MENASASALAGKAVLVTGATGFIGSRLAARLLREGAQVRAVGRRLERIEHLRRDGADVVSVDLLDGDALRQAVEGRDVIFHAAAALGGKPAHAEAVNVGATGELVTLAARAGAGRFVHVSTVGVYDMARGEVLEESTPLVPDHPAPYPRTKARAEIVAFGRGEETGIEVTAVRPSMVYGPGHGIWTVGMVSAIRAAQPVFVGDGSAWFNPVHLDDVVDALLRCAVAPGAPGEAFNVSAGITTWREYMGFYGRLVGAEPQGLPLWKARLLSAANRIPGVRTPVDRGFLEMTTGRKRYPVDKARELLGWEPRVGLEDGLRETARWLEAEGLVKREEEVEPAGEEPGGDVDREGEVGPGEGAGGG